jgi:hypothetical protein
VDGRTSVRLIQDYYQECRILAKVLNVNVNLKGDNPYGEVTDASIEIRAPMERLYIVTENWNPQEEGKTFNMNPKGRTANGRFEDTETRFDFDYEADDGPQEVLRIVKSLEGVDVFALILLKGTWRLSGLICYHALIIAKLNTGEGFQRLGTVSFTEEALGHKPEEGPEGEFPTVVLI